ncbi:MAG: hypothetical protein ABIH59_02165 [archaeon]
MIYLILKIILSVILVWFFLVTVVANLIIPNQRFQTKIMKTQKIKKQAKKLKGKTKKQTLDKIWKFVTNKYVGEPEKFKLLIIPRLFRINIDKLLDEKNYFAACHIQNKIIETLLINSGDFKKQDIKRRYYVTIWLTIHQYLVVKVEGIHYKVDPFYMVFERTK